MRRSGRSTRSVDCSTLGALLTATLSSKSMVWLRRINAPRATQMRAKLEAAQHRP